MGKIKEFFKKIASFFKKKSDDAGDSQSLIIRTFKNGVKTSHYKISGSDDIKKYADLIQKFGKWTDYKIVYDIPGNGINIYFQVKKTADFENISEKEEKR